MRMSEARKEVKVLLLLRLLKEGFLGKNPRDLKDAEEIFREWGKMLGMELKKLSFDREIRYPNFIEQRWIIRYDTGVVLLAIAKDFEGNAIPFTMTARTTMPDLSKIVEEL